MAMSPIISQAAPAQSPEKADVDLRHPIPDLQSLQGAYVGNIERLEEHAERMSEPGSDLGEEIRKLHSELKLSDSRRSSLRSIQALDEPTRQFSSRSRNVSTSSHANSIVDLNGNARWGGYSPGAYITSPVGSLRSGSWSNPSPSIQRQRSESKTSRLGQIVRPEDVADEAERLAAYPGSPKSLPSAPLAAHQRESPPPQEQRKVSSFTRIYDEIANELPEDLRNSVILGQPPNQPDHGPRDESSYHQYADHRDLPDRPPTAASTDTTLQARTLWQDFDGTHCPDTVIEEEDEPSHSGHSRQSSHNSSFMMRSNISLPMDAIGAPPPDEDMVFYPAPVPRMLNLPKRLSQLPAVDVQARRRTQLLETMQLENRISAPLLGDMMSDTMMPNNRKSRQSMMTLPPQLRASAYFDQPGPIQEFAVKGESAEDTLDSILDASAHAPVSAFTDHPVTGHSGRQIYAPQKRQSKLAEIPPTLEQTKRRSSFNLLDTNNNSSGDPLNKLKKRKSSADMNLLIVKASESRMSLGAELDEHDEHARGPDAGDDDEPAKQSFDDKDGRNPDDIYEEQALHEEEPEEQEAQYFGAPTTLLAELQIRKAKQKTRTVNYATLVENGLVNNRRTLLQMDDMAEKEKQKRIRRKVQLAWEAQRDEEDSDDDVPLAVLYKQGGGPQRQEASRPLGLVERRELEDNEPLSRRRTRLLGVDPNRPRDVSPYKRTASQIYLAVPTTTTPGPESEEDEGETLGERMRRLKDKQMLGAALGDDMRKSTVSGDFVAEMFSKFGTSEADEKKPPPPPPPQPTPSPGADEEETLGQRRARLQAEAAARGDAPPTTRPGLRSSHSLADLLAANPLNANNQARKVSNEMLVSHLPPGSLLQQNEVAEERRKAQRLTVNMRASSYGAQLLPTAYDKNDDDVPLAAKIQAYKNIMKGTPTTSSTGAGAQMPMMGIMPDQRNSFMPGMMPMNMNMMSQPNLSMMQSQSMMMGMQPNMPIGFQYPQQQHPGMGVRQSSYPMLGMGMQMGMGMGGNGMNMNMPMGMNMPGMGMGMGGMGGVGMMIPPMDPRQRDQIDQWMQGIHH